TFPFADDRYTYDLLGNRLTDQRQTPGETWQYNQNNELLYSGFATYQYNENGSTTAKQDPSTGQPIQSYAYNSEERMSEVRDAEGNLVAEYYYDPFGRRLWASEREGLTYFAYADFGMSAQLSSATSVPSVHLSTLGLTVDGDAVAIKSGSSYEYLQSDHLGHPTVSSGDEFPRSEVRSSAFGELQSTGLGDIQVRGFRGQRLDSTGLVYNRWRYYNSQVGRYLRADPIGMLAALAMPYTTLPSGIIASGKSIAGLTGAGRSPAMLYVYADNAPLTLVDPTGLWPTVDCPECSEELANAVTTMVRNECLFFSSDASPIRNRILKGCIERQCKTTTIKCLKNCPKFRCPINGGGTYVQPVPNGFHNPPTICLNTQIEGNGEGWQGATAIHEWAHVCKWKHGDGQGIPGDPGPESGKGEERSSGCYPIRDSGSDGWIGPR
ncbi:RHS repeat domain-containing protein, partial [Pseudomarimonas arenosa]